MHLPLIPEGMHARPWPPVLATRGPGRRGVWHSHHALHFVLAIEGELRVRTSREGRWSNAAGVLTSPDAAHAIDAEGVELLLGFLDPESAAGSMFRASLTRAVRLISAAERNALLFDIA